MSMRETILDIVKHTGSLGFIEAIKITGSESETLVEAMDNDRTVIIKANLLKADSDLQGEFGMSHLPLLQGLLAYPNFRTDGASIDVIRRERAGKGNVPEELLFRDEKNQTASYRLMSSEFLPEQAKFLGTNWDVDVEPSVSKIKEFQALAGLYSTFEKYFLAKVVDGELRFYIGDEGSSMHRAFLTIEENVKGALAGDLHWPIAQVLSILKLGQDENLKLQFSSRGALQITMTSPHAEYRFILPARKK